MFHQRDYILRIIEQFGRIMRLLRDRILGRTSKAETTTVQLQKIALEAGLDIDVALALAPESLTVLVMFDGQVEAGRCWLLAELLYLEGLQAHTDGVQPKARACFVRALALFKMLPQDFTPSPEFPLVRVRLGEIESILDSFA